MRAHSHPILFPDSHFRPPDVAMPTQRASACPPYRHRYRETISQMFTIPVKWGHASRR
jgi:hypothetical protein